MNRRCCEWQANGRALSLARRSGKGAGFGLHSEPPQRTTKAVTEPPGERRRSAKFALGQPTHDPSLRLTGPTPPNRRRNRTPVLSGTAGSRRKRQRMAGRQAASAECRATGRARCDEHRDARTLRCCAPQCSQRITAARSTGSPGSEQAVLRDGRFESPQPRGCTVQPNNREVARDTAQ